MAGTVKVSLLHSQGYRANKDEPVTVYERGVREMPVEHAEALGLMHRIVKDDESGGQVPFGGAFDDKLTAILSGGGFTSIDDLRNASSDSLLALDGVGPANFERIQRAINRGK